MMPSKSGVAVAHSFRRKLKRWQPPYQSQGNRQTTPERPATGHTAKMKIRRHGLIAPPPRPWRRRKPAAPWPTAASGDRGRQAKRGRVRNAEKRAGSRFLDFPAGAATMTQQPASTASTSSSSRGSTTSSGPGRAAGASGRAVLPPEPQETHNNQSAVDATTPPLLYDPRCWRHRSRGTGDGPRASRRSRHTGRGRWSVGKHENGGLARGVPCYPTV